MVTIELQNISLDYISKSGSESLKSTLIKIFKRIYSNKKKPSANPNIRNFRALEDINLKINDGDRLGILGRNGAGKSTLLRVLGNIYKPTQGVLKLNGKIAGLFDINLGMHMDATGLENIVNLAIMRGFSKKQSYGIIDDVAEFTELGDFLNRPVHSYSSGMLMKLAFAVATAFPPEILLIDEIIGVGDGLFMKKAKERLTKLIHQSNVLVMTSHSHDIIKSFCNKVIVMDNGVIVFHGNPEEGIRFYEDNILKLSS